MIQTQDMLHHACRSTQPSKEVDFGGHNLSITWIYTEKTKEF
jgi:hypothetical protein